MIKTKIFDGYSKERSQSGYPIFVGVDKQINEFLEIRPNIVLRDIKLTSATYGYSAEELQTETIALIIYEE